VWRFTSTHGAFVPLLLDWYFEVEMVLSTQCIMQPKPRKMLIHVAGDLQLELHQKTLHYIISKLSTGATGYFVEYAGKVFEDMTMEPYDRL
jgi:3-isopropylmalate/(R)-2-methylmalate dehydratase large subunit